MTDERPEEPTSRPNPGASAARRARRIGGRPTPAPAPVTTPAADEPVEPVSTEKAEKPAKTRRRAAPAPADAPAPAGVPAGRGGLPIAWVPAALLGAAAVVLLVLVVVFGHHGYWGKPSASSDQTPSQEEQQQVLAAAKSCFAQVNTYSYKHLDSDLEKNLGCITGTFTSDYKVYFKATIQKLAPTVKATQSVQVNRAGIVSISSDGKQWTILVWGQLSTTNSTTTKTGPRIAPTGGVLTMDNVGGTWKIAKLDSDVGNGLGS